MRPNHCSNLHKYVFINVFDSIIKINRFEAPIAMRLHGVFYGKKLTSYPSPNVEKLVMEGNHYTYMRDDVVVDGNLITSQGNFTSFNFALTLVEKLTDIENARETGSEMIWVF